MSVTFFAAADLHLGRSSSVGGSQKTSVSAREGWKRLVNKAISENVDALLLSGDLVDKENNYFEALSALEIQLKRLESENIHTVIVAGNHDATVLPEMMNMFRSSDFIHFLGVNGEWEVKKIDFSSGKSAQFLGWSFPAEHVFVNPLNTLALDELEIQADLPLIGLIHGEITNADSNYAPISLSSLQQHKVVDAWLAGHIHLPSEFQHNQPFICYTGSLQALSAKERGAHGFQKLVIDESGNLSHYFQNISPVRYEKIVADVTDISDERQFRRSVIEAIDRVTGDFLYADLSHLVIDILLSGDLAMPHEIDTWISGSDIYEYEQMQENTRITIRKISNHTRFKAGNLEQLADEKSPAGLLAGAILDLESNNENPFTQKLVKSFAERTENINRASVYMPLNVDQKIESESMEHRQLLIDECHRLLSEMMILKQNSKN